MIRRVSLLRRVFVIAGALACLGIVGACASPTLPLPPPAVPDVGPSTEAGRVHLFSRHGAEANAIIVVVNLNPSVPLNQRVDGAQADQEGTWDADVLASSGDVLEITQEFGGTRSAGVRLKVP
jgi:hypothetical protein